MIPQDKDKNPRRLTPEECKRLMGYPKEFLIKDIGVSDTQLYKQFGNSVAVPVVKAMATAMMEVMKPYGKDKMEEQRKERGELLKGQKVIAEVN